MLSGIRRARVVLKPRGALCSLALLISILQLQTTAAAQEEAEASAPRSRTSLAAVLAFADAHAPAIVLARARLEEGRAAREGADRLLSAPLQVGAAIGPRFADATGEDFDVQLSVSQTIEVGGERGLRQDAASRLSERRDAELTAVLWQVHREVHFAFHEAIEARVREEAERRWVAFAERMVAIATTREAAGDVGPLEVMTARAEHALALQRLRAAELRQRAATLTLAEASGWPASSPPIPAGDLEAPHAIPEDADLVSRALENHPLIHALSAAVTERSAALRVSEREATPTLDVVLLLSREGSAGSPANYIGLLTLGVAIPVWNPNTAERAQAGAQLSIAEAELLSQQSAMQARVLRASATVRSSREQVRIFEEDVLPGFEQHVALLEQAFSLGELNALDVGIAARRLLEAQDNALNAFAEYHRALAELEAEVGDEVVPDNAHGGGR